MKAIEFQAPVRDDGTLAVPPVMASMLRPGQLVRVLILVAESTEDEDWNRLAAEQFFKGYAESDAIYDQLPDR